MGGQSGGNPGNPANVSPLMAGFIPINNEPGTLPIAAESQPGALSESPDSPETELNEHCSVIRVFQGGYNVCRANQRFPGSLVSDTEGNTFKTLSSKIRHRKGNRATLTITDEWVSGPSLVPPPDEFDVDPAEANPAIEKNPLYITSSDPNAPHVLSDEDIMRIKQAVEAPQPLGRSDNGSNPYRGVDEREQLWDNLLSKLRRGEDVYYLSGFRIYWTRYYFTPQRIDRGGYIQAPASDVHGDIIPGFFVRDAFNHITLPVDTDLAWLRLADKVGYSRTWFKHTRIWLLGPDGQWDADIYPDYFDTTGTTLSRPDTATDPSTY